MIHRAGRAAMRWGWSGLLGGQLPQLDDGGGADRHDALPPRTGREGGGGGQNPTHPPQHGVGNSWPEMFTPRVTGKGGWGGVTPHTPGGGGSTPSNTHRAFWWSRSALLPAGVEAAEGLLVEPVHPVGKGGGRGRDTRYSSICQDSLGAETAQG